MSFNVQNNPFQGSYLFNFSFQPPDPSQRPDQAGQPFSGGLYNSQNFLADTLRDRDQLGRKKKNGALSPDNVNRMLSQLSLQQGEVSRLKNQIDAAKDPLLRDRLESSLGQKSLSFNNLQSQISLQFKALNSGFLGSENKIDHPGSFVTFG
ncbi:MAG: hypothetical protein K0Q50_2363 [Vampirovibrio sp.]|nr:hypothetical protein [Vampirovibrio sp.]